MPREKSRSAKEIRIFEIDTRDSDAGSISYRADLFSLNIETLLQKDERRFRDNAVAKEIYPCVNVINARKVFDEPVEITELLMFFEIKIYNVLRLISCLYIGGGAK